MYHKYYIHSKKGLGQNDIVRRHSENKPCNAILSWGPGRHFSYTKKTTEARERIDSYMQMPSSFGSILATTFFADIMTKEIEEFWDGTWKESKLTIRFPHFQGVDSNNITRVSDWSLQGFWIIGNSALLPSPSNFFRFPHYIISAKPWSLQNQLMA